MAVYNRKDFENFLNKEKIKKQKIRKLKRLKAKIKLEKQAINKAKK